MPLEEIPLWIIVVGIVFMLYVIFSLSTIKYQLKIITEHLGVKEEKKIATISNEEIEKELENELLK